MGGVRLDDADIVKGEIVVCPASHARGEIDPGNKAVLADPATQQVKQDSGAATEIADLQSLAQPERINNMSKSLQVFGG